MRDLIKQLLNHDSHKTNNVYLNEIALLMEENDNLKKEVLRLNDIIEKNVRK